jgi:hypothetical protein
MHVMREQNVVADELANQGIDKKHAVPQEIKAWLSTYEITL